MNQMGILSRFGDHQMACCLEIWKLNAVLAIIMGQKLIE